MSLSGLSGGKDSVTLLEALCLLQKRAPIDFTVCAFTVEQGKFLRPIAPFGDYLKQRGIDWLYKQDEPSLRLIDEQPDHGCDLCSRFRRRAVYEIGRELGANVIAFGHTADDFCESLLRNAMFTGRLSALPPVTYSTQEGFPADSSSGLCDRRHYARYAASLGSAGDSVRLFAEDRDRSAFSCAIFFADLEQDHPFLKENLLSAMGNIEPQRLLDVRYLDTEAAPNRNPARCFRC